MNYVPYVNVFGAESGLNLRKKKATWRWIFVLFLREFVFPCCWAYSGIKYFLLKIKVLKGKERIFHRINGNKKLNTSKGVKVIVGADEYRMEKKGWNSGRRERKQHGRKDYAEEIKIRKKVSLENYVATARKLYK